MQILVNYDFGKSVHQKMGTSVKTDLGINPGFNV